MNGFHLDLSINLGTIITAIGSVSMAIFAAGRFAGRLLEKMGAVEMLAKAVVKMDARLDRLERTAGIGAPALPPAE